MSCGIHSGLLVLVNAEHPIRRRERPVLAPAAPGSDVLLDTRAAAMLTGLISRLGAAGEIVPVSGWRSMREQREIWDGSMAENGTEFTRKYVALPGCSEHQTGLAIDLGENRPDIDFLCPAFPDDGPCGALRRRAADYGFVLRYPRGKEDVTGIGHEPWHFRYVGWPHARLMEEHHLVLEEYLSWLHGFPLGAEPLRYQGLGRRFEISYVPAEQASDLELPANLPCQTSDTNEGGVVLTVWRDAG